MAMLDAVISTPYFSKNSSSGVKTFHSAVCSEYYSVGVSSYRLVVEAGLTNKISGAYIHSTTKSINAGHKFQSLSPRA